MIVAERMDDLIHHLPPVRGDLQEDAPLGAFTWFRTGGTAEVMFRPADIEDLSGFLMQTPTEIPVHVIGVGSNLLIRDGGVPGVVIRLTKSFAGIQVADTQLRVGGSALDVTVSNAAREANVAGLEFLRGIPGAIGGAIVMNAGAYGRDMSMIVKEATLVRRDGTVICMRSDDLGFSYRKAVFPKGAIVVSALLEGTVGERADIEATMAGIMAEREDTQPLRTRTGGSTFKNPDPEHSGGRKAWQLIDQAGCRGMPFGGAMVSEKHCNFLINTGTASSFDLENLGEQVRKRVFDQTGVRLEWEIRRLGRESGVGQ